jgi:hypothetical protein
MILAEKQIPPEELTHWKELLRVNTQRNLRITWKLIKCVELLFNNEIECIVLKGPTIAIQAYGALTLRQYTDLDLLIHQIDFPKAYDLLVKSGYTPAFTMDEKQIKFEIKSGHHFSFTRQGDLIEMHWDIAPRANIRPLSAEQMWQQLNSVRVFDKDIWTLSPENTILFTCLHGAIHSWNQLKWIVDLAYTCQSFSEKAWLVLLERAKHMGLFRQVCVGLLLAEDLVDVEFPLRIHALIKTDRVGQMLASQVKACLFKRSTKPPLFVDFAFYLQTRERWSDRLNFLLNLIFIPKPEDWLMISLPENLYFIYSIVRPIRLLIKLGKAAISVLA